MFLEHSNYYFKKLVVSWIQCRNESATLNIWTGMYLQSSLYKIKSCIPSNIVATCVSELCSPVLRAHLVGRSVVQDQRVAVVIQHPHRLFSLETEAACHGYDGGRRLVGVQPLSRVKTDGIDDQHARTIGEPQLRNHKQKKLMLCTFQMYTTVQIGHWKWFSWNVPILVKLI